MILKNEQIDYYNENGYLIINNLFSKPEIDNLNAEATKFSKLKELPNVILEKNGQIRSVFAPHTLSKKYDNLYKQDRLVNPAKQLLGGDVYLYQFKLNNKKAFIGDWWEWHQDFPYWHLDDGVDTPQMVSAMILLQDTTTIQGPLIFIPKSHKKGIVDFEPKEHHKLISNSGVDIDIQNSLNADLKYTIKKNIITDLINKNGFFEASGVAGSCIFFHPNLFHASNSNISPFERNTAIVTYNNVFNLPLNKKSKRPEYLCSRDFEPIKILQTN
jgi:ectoine hydroxylase